jgi:predicted esterase
MVIHGGLDRMITFPHGEELLKALGGEDRGVTKRFEPGQGHVIPIEMRNEFGAWVEELVLKAEQSNNN